MHLRLKTESQPLITWPEGNGRLVQHLFEKAKANIQLDRAAVELIPTDDGVDVVTLDHNGSEPRGFHAQRVIFAAPQFMARYVVRPYRDNPPPHIAEFQFGAWMVANLTLKDRPKARFAARFSARVGQRSLREPVARIRGGDAPARAGSWSNCADLLLSAL